MGTELDVERQVSQLAATQATVPALESAKQMSIHRLSVLLGEEPGALVGELSQAKPLPTTPPIVPVGLSGIVAIAAGDYHSLALRTDGRVIAWGANVFGYGQTNVPVLG